MLGTALERRIAAVRVLAATHSLAEVKNVASMSEVRWFAPGS